MPSRGTLWTDRLERLALGRIPTLGMAIAFLALGVSTLQYDLDELASRNGLVVLAWAAATVGFGCTFIGHRAIAHATMGAVIMIHSAFRGAAMFSSQFEDHGFPDFLFGASRAWTWTIFFFTGLILWGAAREEMRMTREGHQLDQEG